MHSGGSIFIADNNKCIIQSQFSSVVNLTMIPQLYSGQSLTIVAYDPLYVTI